MRTINRILKKLRSDDGDGVLVLTIIYIPLAVILLGLVINVGHVVTNRAEYSAMARLPLRPQSSISTPKEA